MSHDDMAGTCWVPLAFAGGWVGVGYNRILQTHVSFFLRLPILPLLSLATAIEVSPVGRHRQTLLFESSCLRPPAGLLIMFFLNHYGMLAGGALGALTTGLVAQQLWALGLPRLLSQGPDRQVSRSCELHLRKRRAHLDLSGL